MFSRSQNLWYFRTFQNVYYLSISRTRWDRIFLEISNTHIFFTIRLVIVYSFSILTDTLANTYTFLPSTGACSQSFVRLTLDFIKCTLVHWHSPSCRIHLFVVLFFSVHLCTSIHTVLGHTRLFQLYALVHKLSDIAERHSPPPPPPPPHPSLPPNKGVLAVPGVSGLFSCTWTAQLCECEQVNNRKSYFVCVKQIAKACVSEYTGT